MLTKLQSELVLVLSKIDKLKIQGMPYIMIYLFLSLIISCILLFLAAWSWDWYTTGKPNLPVMIQMVVAMTSMSFVAAIGFFGKAMVDKDNDGIPDEFEEENVQSPMDENISGSFLKKRDDK